MDIGMGFRTEKQLRMQLLSYIHIHDSRKKEIRWHCAMTLYTGQKYKTVNPWDLQTFAGWDEKRRLKKKQQ